MDATNYRIRGFTGPNADFDFEYLAETGTLHGDELRAAVMDELATDCGWYEAVKNVEPYYLGEDEERSDLRDVDTQRVYLFIDHEGGACPGESCEGNDFMIVVDIAA